MRRYKAYFVSKLTDCDGENAETDTCWDFAQDCSYISPEEHTEMTSLNHEVGKMLGSMISNPEKIWRTTGCPTLRSPMSARPFNERTNSGEG